MADDTLAILTDNSTTFSTLDSSQSQHSSSKQLDVTRDELEKRQLLHTIELLRLEVSQKQLVLDSVRTEQASQLEEMRERLADASHEKKLLGLRLQSMTHAYEQELKVVKESSRRELAASSEQPQLDVRREVEVALQDPYLSEEDYRHLTSNTTDTATLSLSDYIKIRYHDLTQSTLKQCEQFQASVNELTQQLRSRDEEITRYREELSCSKEQSSHLERQCEQQVRELASIRTQIQEGNYKIDNFDAVKRNRDDMKRELDSVRCRLEEKEARERERDEHTNKTNMELSALQQTVGLLKQDKQYLERQVCESDQRTRAAEERSASLNQQLEEVKMDREKAFQQLVKSKEEGRVDYDQRLQSEVEGLRARTALELEQLRTQTREMYERESRCLREAKESALEERDRALANEREVDSKYKTLVKEHHSMQAMYDGCVSVLQGELQLAQFDKERTKGLYEEMSKDLKHCQLEQEKLQKKVDLLTNELWSTETKKEATVRERDAQLKEVQQRLESYEKIERELDDIVLQSAQMEHECDAEKVLFSYGFGTSVPTTSRRRLQQSVQLARRVLHLERMNTSLRNQLEVEEKRSKNLTDKLQTAQDLLDKSRQPYSYLIEDIQERDIQLCGLREACDHLEREVAALKTERANMVESSNQMARDLERLLSHREELHMIKQVLLGVLGKQRGASLLGEGGVATSASKPHPLDDTPAHNTPSPTQFTKQVS